MTATIDHENDDHSDFKKYISFFLIGYCGIFGRHLRSDCLALGQHAVHKGEIKQNYGFESAQ